ncbi:MAG: 50S ribosomal protein L29 [Candidatus Thorarchaeota archaeon]
MAILRKSQIRKMSPQDRQKKITELKTELLAVKGKAKSGSIESAGRVRLLRQTIARLHTIGKEENDAR